MKIVKVTYTVKEEFSEANISNVRAVMSALQAAGSPGVHPKIYLQDHITSAALAPQCLCATVCSCLS